jgi:hypothetical protein
MLKRPVVSLFHSLKSKGKRYYWEQPKNDIIDELPLIKQKYDIPKEIVDHMKNQEKQIKEIKDELTNQKKYLKILILMLKTYMKVLIIFMLFL